MKFPTSQIARISGGEIEYALTGQGTMVLVSHGTLGGYDQALAIAHLFTPEKFRFLAVSRAGYLRSAPTTGRTPQEQASSYAQLLDIEGIQATAVIGLSGGAPSAIKFAQEYPQRCRALVLISSITVTPPLPPFFRLVVRMQDLMMKINPIWALVYRYGLPLLVRSNGVHSRQVKQIWQDVHKQRVVQGIFHPITSASVRRAGVRLDDTQIQSLSAEAHLGIGVPTFVCHAANDPLAPVSDATRLATSVPNAEYLEMIDGGHLFFVVHSEQVIPKIERFLLAHAS